MKVTKGEAQTLRDRLVQLYSVPTYDPATMVTVNDMAQAWEVTYPTAQRRIAAMVERGELRVLGEVITTRGKKATAYVSK